jgi:hypothetical protein
MMKRLGCSAPHAPAFQARPYPYRNVDAILIDRCPARLIVAAASMTYDMALPVGPVIARL